VVLSKLKNTVLTNANGTSQSSTLTMNGLVLFKQQLLQVDQPKCLSLNSSKPPRKFGHMSQTKWINGLQTLMLLLKRMILFHKMNSRNSEHISIELEILVVFQNSLNLRVNNKALLNNSVKTLSAVQNNHQNVFKDAHGKVKPLNQPVVLH